MKCLECKNHQIRSVISTHSTELNFIFWTILIGQLSQFEFSNEYKQWSIVSYHSLSSFVSICGSHLLRLLIRSNIYIEVCCFDRVTLIRSLTHSFTGTFAIFAHCDHFETALSTCWWVTYTQKNRYNFMNKNQGLLLLSFRMLSFCSFSLSFVRFTFFGTKNKLLDV